MKRVLIMLLLSLFAVTITVPTYSQSGKTTAKKLLNVKVPKDIKKEAKKYQREGYYVAIGALPLERQLTDAWVKATETDESGYPAYIIASARSVAETQFAAKLTAMEAAKMELAGTISTNVAALIESNIANAQLNSEEANTVTKTIAASTSIIAQEIGRTITLVEVYKKINKNTEANVRVAYSSKMAEEMGKKVIKQQLEEETQIVRDKLEKLMNF